MDRDEFLRYFKQVRERTMRLVRCVPPGKIEWTYREGEFTLGDLARHLAATERRVFAECVSGRPSRYKGCGRELADGLDNVIAYMERLHAESLEIFRAMTEADLQKKVMPPQAVSVTAWKMLRATLEHEIHHRGQIYVYLGILGVPVPSLFGLNERQLQEVSA